MMSIEKILYNKFVGNPNRYIIWRNGWVSEELPITKALIMKHLRGEIAIGSYPIYREAGNVYCRWICLDVDAHEQPEELDYLYPQLNDFYDELLYEEEIPLESMILEFSGGGYHLWILLEDKTPLELAAKFIYELRQTLNTYVFCSCVEVFPKQMTIENLPKGVGNAVRLPCGKNIGKGLKTKIITGNIYDIKPFNIEAYDSVEIPAKFSTNGYCNPRKDIEIYNPRDIDEELDFWLEFPLKPCIKMIIKGETQCHSLGEVGHKVRMAVVHECRYYKIPEEVIWIVFRNQSDYDPIKVMSQVRSVIESSTRKDGRYSCDKINEMGFCHKNYLGCDYEYNRI